MIGLYVHVPFCERKCPYCAFYSRPFSGQTADAYAAALHRCILGFGDDVKADTLYFGGGTPPLLGTENIGRTIELCRQRFGLDNAEITLECNPNSIDRPALRRSREYGVNRLSVGVQSLDDGELAFLGRLHDSRQAEQTIVSAREEGFENISADLMIGIKGQTCEKLADTVSKLSSLGASHISAYMIKVEQGTAFDCDEVRSRLLDDDELSQLYLGLVDICAANGFAQYEISNFARIGFESRHNCKYWECGEYLGFGAAAHSFYNGERFCCPDDLGRYISEGQTKIVTDSSPDAAEEYVMLGLRLCKGISLDRFAGISRDPECAVKMRSLAERLARVGYCRFDGDNISLTPRGMLVSNSIIAEFLSL